MHLSPSLNQYTKEQLSAREAQRLAEFISWGPAVFQASRLMIKFGILDLIRDSADGITREEIVQQISLSDYAVKCLLEASLCIGIVIIDPDTERFTISKAGWFLLNDKITRVNIDFNHNLNYKAWYNIEESLINGKPEGLKHFGPWDTIYEGLSQLPNDVQQSWFGFDHFYSDSAFPQALDIVFNKHNVKTLYDIGGNTGKWALQCVDYNADVEVTVIDLPQQILMLQRSIANNPNAHRIKGLGINILDTDANIPKREGKLDAIWMSQFLDCFSMEQIVDILRKARRAMDSDTRIFIMETLWDRQKYEPAAMNLMMTSLYFSAVANGNSKMYNTADLSTCIEQSGLAIEAIYDHIGLGHSIIVCRIQP